MEEHQLQHLQTEDLAQMDLITAIVIIAPEDLTIIIVAELQTEVTHLAAIATHLEAIALAHHVL